MAPPSKSKTGPRAKGPPGSLSPPAARATTDSKADAAVHVAKKAVSSADQQTPAGTSKAGKHRDARAKTARAASKRNSSPQACPWDLLETDARSILAELLTALVSCCGCVSHPLLDEYNVSDIAERHGLHHEATRAAVTGAIELLQDRAEYTTEDGRRHPRLPKTAAEAARLQAQIDKWLQEDDIWTAFPSVCTMAVYGLWTRPEHADTVGAVQAVADSLWQQGDFDQDLHVWLLPRAAGEFGIASSNTRQLVVRAAEWLCTVDDARQCTKLTSLVIELAQQLPGGLGWGSTVVAPVPDADLYNMHVVMQTRGEAVIEQGHYKLAQDMLKRCVAYFDTLGSNWLAVARKADTHFNLSYLVLRSEGPAAAEPLIRETRRKAARDIGADHSIVASAACLYAKVLQMLKRPEKAVSVMRQAVRDYRLTELMSADMLRYQAAIAEILQSMNKDEDAQGILQEVNRLSVKLWGPGEGLR